MYNLFYLVITHSNYKGNGKIPKNNSGLCINLQNGDCYAVTITPRMRHGSSTIQLFYKISIWNTSYDRRTYMMDRFQKAWGWHTLKILIVLKKAGVKKINVTVEKGPFSKPRCYIPVLFIRCYYRSVLAYLNNWGIHALSVN